ncbi:hypothetical protein N7486_006505 [Penicillium sp. IBT 16267x]|nr:hypothetical protein N7486_006505 [Penicillium sp. IBT 16267x]
MSTYEGKENPALRTNFKLTGSSTVEHGTADPATNPQSTTRRRRPDLSTFFATLSEISPDPDHPDHRPHAVPVPGDVSAAFYSLAEAFEVMRREAATGGAEGEDLLTQMIQNLLSQADMPPREVEGVSEEFCDCESFPALRMDFALDII